MTMKAGEYEFAGRAPSIRARAKQILSWKFTSAQNVVACSAGEGCASRKMDSGA